MSAVLDYRLHRACRVANAYRGTCPPTSDDYAYFTPPPPDARISWRLSRTAPAPPRRCVDVSLAAYAIRAAHDAGLVDPVQLVTLLAHLFRIQWTRGRIPCVSYRRPTTDLRDVPIYDDLLRTHSEHRAPPLASAPRRTA